MKGLMMITYGKLTCTSLSKINWQLIIDKIKTMWNVTTYVLLSFRNAVIIVLISQNIVYAYIFVK